MSGVHLFLHSCLSSSKFLQQFSYNPECHNIIYCIPSINCRALNVGFSRSQAFISNCSYVSDEGYKKYLCKINAGSTRLSCK